MDLDQKTLVIFAHWMEEKATWVATCSELPEFITQAETVEALCSKLKRMIPEFLKAAGICVQENIYLEVMAQRFLMAPPVSEPVSLPN